MRFSSIIPALIFAIGPASLALAQGPSPAAVVKLTSSDPTGTLGVRKGSGLLIREASVIYVLTSDHVVFRGDGYRQLAWNETWGNLPAHYLFADWGRGISVLKLEEPAAKPLLTDPRIPDFSSLSGIENLQRAPVEVMGYAAGSNSLIQHDLGLANSPLFIFGMVASLRYMAFLQGSYAEFGMSGGPVFLKSGEFLGVLSHLFVAGAGDSASEWTENSGPDPMVLVVSFDQIREYLASFFQTGKPSGWEFFLPEGPVKENHLTLQSSHLEFDIVTCPSVGIVCDVGVTYLDPEATPALHWPGQYSLLQKIQDKLGSLPPGASRKSRFVGIRSEHGFQFDVIGSFELVNFQQFVTGIQWSNIRGIARYRDPEPAELKARLKGFLGECQSLLKDKSAKLEPFHKDRLRELIDNLGYAVSDISSMKSAWMVASPYAVEEVLRAGPENAKFRQLLEKIASYVGQYAI